MGGEGKTRGGRGKKGERRGRPRELVRCRKEKGVNEGKREKT